MKFYELNTPFTFGKYQGQTVKEVFETYPSYIEFCVVNLDHFYLDDEVVEEMKILKPNFHFSQQALARLGEKYNEWLKEEEEDDHSPIYSSYDNRDLDRDNFWALTDGMLGDYDDWSDSGLDIDDAMTYMRG